MSSISLGKDSVDLVVNERTHGMLPAFNSVTVLKSKFRRSNMLVMPVIGLKGDVYMAIQILTDAKKEVDKGKRVAEDPVFPN